MVSFSGSPKRFRRLSPFPFAVASGKANAWLASALAAGDSNEKLAGDGRRRSSQPASAQRQLNVRAQVSSTSRERKTAHAETRWPLHSRVSRVSSSRTSNFWHMARSHVWHEDDEVYFVFALADGNRRRKLDRISQENGRGIARTTTGRCKKHDIEEPQQEWRKNR